MNQPKSRKRAEEKVGQPLKQTESFDGLYRRRKPWLALTVILIVATGLLGYYIFSPIILAGLPEKIVSSDWIEGKDVYQVSLLEGRHYVLKLDAKNNTSPELVSVKVYENEASEVFWDRIYELEYSPGHTSTYGSVPPTWYYLGDLEFTCAKTGNYNVVSEPVSEGPYSVKLVQWAGGPPLGGWILISGYVWFGCMLWVPWLIKPRVSARRDNLLVNALFAIGLTLFVLLIVMVNLY